MPSVSSAGSIFCHHGGSLRRELLQGRRRNAPSQKASRWRGGGVVAPRLPFAYVTLTDGSPRAALVYGICPCYIHTVTAHCSWKANTTTSLRPSKANAASSPPPRRLQRASATWRRARCSLCSLQHCSLCRQRRSGFPLFSGHVKL